MQRPDQPPPLPYETPGKLPHADPLEPGRRKPVVPGSFDWNICVRATLMLVAFWGIAFYVIPRFEENFAGMGIELPNPTRLLIAIGRAVRSRWWLALLAIPPGLGFVVGQFDRIGRALCRTAIVLLFGALVVFVVLGLFAPMMTMMESMTSHR